MSHGNLFWNLCWFSMRTCVCMGGFVYVCVEKKAERKIILCKSLALHLFSITSSVCFESFLFEISHVGGRDNIYLNALSSVNL